MSVYTITPVDLVAATEKAETRLAAFHAATGPAKEMARLGYVEASAVQYYIETRLRVAARRSA
jgi:hypothetical protein